MHALGDGVEERPAPREHLRIPTDDDGGLAAAGLTARAPHRSVEHGNASVTKLGGDGRGGLGMDGALVDDHEPRRGGREGAVCAEERLANELRGHETGDHYGGAARRIRGRASEHASPGRVLVHAIGSDVVTAYGMARPAEIFG